MTLDDALDTVRRVAAVRATDVQTLALARAHRRVLAEPMLTPDGLPFDGVGPGQALTPLRIARAAGAGVEIARVRRRPTVAVFVVDGPDRSAIDAAQGLLTGLLRADGLEPTAWPTLPADARSVEVAIRDAGCAFDAIAVCGGTEALTLVDGVLAAFGDVRVDGLAIDGAARALRFATLDAACVLALPLDPLTLAGLHLTIGRALVDALEVRSDVRTVLHGRLAGERCASNAFGWAHASIDAQGASVLTPLRTATDPADEANAVLPPVLYASHERDPSVARALPLPGA